jgi:hypothetical protein
MHRRIVASLLASPLLLLASLSASAQTTTSSNAQRALQWLQCTQQQANGQIGSGGNPIARSSEVAFSLAAAGQDAAAMRHGTVSLADYLKTAVSTDVGTNGELLLARASQPDAGPTATVAAQLQASKSISGETAGEFGGDIFSDALAILGLRAADQAVGNDAIAFLEGKQNSADHGWSFDNAGQFGSDSNTTALVLQALIGAGVPTSDVHVTNGFQFMASQFVGGGFVSQADPTKPANDASNIPDANSDELAVEAIIAAALQTDEHWASRLLAAENDLVGRQITSGADAGALSGFSKLFATTEAPAAFLQRSLTARGIAGTKLALLACPAATTTTATPQPSHTAVPVLAKTGRTVDGRPLLGGMALIALASILLWGPRRRARTP